MDREPPRVPIQVRMAQSGLKPTTNQHMNPATTTYWPAILLGAPGWIAMVSIIIWTAIRGRQIPSDQNEARNLSDKQKWKLKQMLTIYFIGIVSALVGTIAHERLFPGRSLLFVDLFDVASSTILLPYSIVAALILLALFRIVTRGLKALVRMLREFVDDMIKYCED